MNDGPALASSDIGIAMGAAGSDVAIESATIALMNNNLRLIPFLFSLAKDTRAIIIQNFFIGGFFIIFGISFATMGRLSPIIAAIMQVRFYFSCNE